jgi:hypothetical protein
LQPNFYVTEWKKSKNKVELAIGFPTTIESFEEGGIKPKCLDDRKHLIKSKLGLLALKFHSEHLEKHNLTHSDPKSWSSSFNILEL